MILTPCPYDPIRSDELKSDPVMPPLGVKQDERRTTHGYSMSRQWYVWAGLRSPCPVFSGFDVVRSSKPPYDANG